MDDCRHNPFEKNTLIVEAHWAAGVRVRCRICGSTSYVSKKGRVKPEKVAIGASSVSAVRRGIEMSESKPFGDLRPNERSQLEMRLDDLLRFMGSPGDWGYGTQMADATIWLLDFRARYQKAKEFPDRT